MLPQSFPDHNQTSLSNTVIMGEAGLDCIFAFGKNHSFAAIQLLTHNYTSPSHAVCVGEAGLDCIFAFGKNHSVAAI